MSNAANDTVQKAIREESGPLVVGRIIKVLIISIVGLIFSAASDLRIGSTPPWALIDLKLGGAVAQAIALGALQLARSRGWKTTVSVAVASWIIACGCVAVNGYYTGDVIMPTMLLPLMVVAAPIVFPWGLISQTVLALVTAPMILPQAEALGTNLLVSVGSVFAASVFLAASFERHQRSRKAIELLQRGQQAVTELIAAEAGLDEVFAQSLTTVWQQAPEIMSAVLLLDHDSGRLRRAASRGLSEAYTAALEQIDVRRNGEWCHAVHSGQRVITEDITTDPHWADMRFLAITHGLRSTWSEPILSSDGAVLGLLSIYRNATHVPEEREIHFIAGMARQLGIAIDRRAAREQLERYLGALEEARSQAETQAAQLRQQAFQLAEARDQAVAAVRARSQFLANMSHEIRTPLNGILGVADMLMDSELTPGQQEQTRILSQCGEHLLGVINDILDFSKIEAGKVTIERIDLDLRAIIEDVGAVMAQRAQAKGIELVTVIPPALDSTVKGDPARLRQVLVNLVGNAIKFTEKGEVVIELTVVEDTAATLGFAIAVRDTGIGIALERQSAVFDSFTQADGSTTRNYGGTGLGLTITRELVHLMGGKIGLRSTPGEGSTFWIDLRLDRAPALTFTRATPEVLKDLRVLIVDDNETNRMILNWSLQGWGCRVQEAADGREALRLLAHAVTDNPFGLVLLDMQMPDMSGIRIAQEMKATSVTASIPIILLSSVGGLRGGETEAQVRGIAAAITKPVRQGALLDAMLGALGDDKSQRNARRAAPATVTATATFGLHVLLAEDNHVNQLVARRILEKLGCTIDVVETGREAVDAVAKTPYDLVLMDIQMPVMDGFEATTLIRAAETTTHLPIIAMTAHAMQGDRERCLSVGMDGYVSKPVNIAGLADAIADLQGRVKIPGVGADAIAKAS